MQKKPPLRPLSLFIGEGGRHKHLMHRQNEMLRMHITRYASPTCLKHMQESPPSSFNTIIIFHKPFKSQHSTFKTIIFSPGWNSTKTPAKENGGHCEYYDLWDSLIDRPGHTGPVW